MCDNNAPSHHHDYSPRQLLRNTHTTYISAGTTGRTSHGGPVKSAVAETLRLYSEATIKGPGSVRHTAANLPPSEIPTTSTTQPKAPGVVFGKTSDLSLNAPSQPTYF